MDRSLASRVREANSALIDDGDRDAIDQFFTPDYVAHGTD